jgi:hypothetical protein
MPVTKSQSVATLDTELFLAALCELCTRWEEANDGEWAGDKAGLEDAIKATLRDLVLGLDSADPELKAQVEADLGLAADVYAEVMLAGPAREQVAKMVAAKKA